MKQGQASLLPAFPVNVSRRQQFLLDAARVSAIIACVALLYSPTVASVGLISAYVTFLGSGQVACRFGPMLGRPLFYWAVAFLGIVLLATLYASVPWPDRLVDFYKWRTVLWFFVLLALFGDQVWKERLLIAFIIGTAIGVVASFTASTGLVTFPHGPEALLRNSATQGMAFAVSALICLWKWLERGIRDRMSGVWALLGTLYVLNVVFITPGKGGYAVLGFGAAVLLFWQTPPRLWLAVLLGLSCVGAAAFSLSPLMRDRIDRSLYEWTHADELTLHTPLGTRRVFFMNTLDLIKEHWLFGVGTGGFRTAYGDLVAKKYEPSDWRAEPTGDPHNQYLAVLAQQGVVGFAVFLLWLLAIVRDRESMQWYRGLALSILCGWLVTSLFSSHFRTFAEGHLLASFLGVLLAAPVPGSNSCAEGKQASKGGMAS